MAGILLPQTGLLAQQVEPGAIGYYNEALLFSQTNPFQSARTMGMGGTQVALGGDASSIFANPAGLGVYRRSEISFSPNMEFANSETEYFGSTTSNFRNKFSIPNLGLVIFSDGDENAAFKGGSFGISLTKINDFDNRFSYNGENFDNSIIDFFLEDASGLTPGQLGGLTGFAYDHYLINPANAAQNQYYSDVAGFPIQEEDIRTDGAQYQWSFGYGANFNDRIYLGLNLGITSLNYSERKTFREYDFFDPANPNDVSVLNDLSLTEGIDITGSGFNASVGAIFRPAAFLRLGASITTPTYYRLNEESFFDFTTNYNNYYFAPDDTVLTNITTNSDLFLSRYDISTPLKLSTGAAIFIGKSGFITVETDFVNYRGITIQSGDFSANADNQTIDNIYNSTVNLRVGGEIRMGNLRLRGGFARLGDAFSLDDGFDRSTKILSGGAGVRFDSYFLDFAVQHGWRNGAYSPYETFNSPSPVATTASRSTNATISVGWFF